jgi:hypothetical protein
MNPFDTKKFITGFLILAVIASSSALLLSSVLGKSPTPSKSADIRGSVAENTVPANAFVETLPGDNSSASGADDNNLPLPELSSNFTDNVSAQLARELVKINPQGPIDGGDGQPSLTAPDVDSVLASIASAGVANGVEIPDWNKDVNAAIAKVKESKSNDQKQIDAYGAYFSNTLDRNFISTKFDDLVTADPTLDNVNMGEAAIDQAIKETAQPEVPSSLYEFHKAYARLLVYQKNTLALGQMAPDDPLKATLIMQSYDGQYTDALSNFQEQFQKVATLLHEDGPQGSRLAEGVRALLGIKTAHAFLGLGDITFSPVEFARSLWEWVQKILLDFVRDRIIHQLVQQTIQWVNGGFSGSPQFVSNWRSFLTAQANIGAGDAINSLAPGFCRGFGPLLRVQLESTYLAAVPAVSCTLDQVVQNVEHFYNDFSQGGWVGYGQLALPDGNYFGQLFAGSQLIEARKAAETQAKAADAAAGGGIGSQETCVAFTIVNEYKDCLATVASEGKDPHECLIYPDQDQQVCSKHEITTPGQAIGQNLYNSLGSPIQRIVNAQDIRALISSFINAALTRLTTLVAGRPDPRGLLGLGTSTTSGTGTGPGAATSTESCALLTGDALVQCFTQQSCSSLTGEEYTNCVSSWIAVNCAPTTVNEGVNLHASGVPTPPAPGGTGSGGTTSVPIGGSISTTRYNCSGGPSAIASSSCTTTGGSPFGSAQCGGQGGTEYPNCGTFSDGSLAYDLRVGHIDLDPASHKLYNVGTGGAFTAWDWYATPSASDLHAWCAPNIDLQRTSPPAQAPVQPPTVRCIDGTDGGVTSGTTVCSSEGGSEGGGENCGSGCDCKGQDGISGADFCFLDQVKVAQRAVEQDFRDGVTGTGLISDSPASVGLGDGGQTYAIAVGNKLKSLYPELMPITDREELGIIGSCDKAVTGKTVDVGPGMRREQTAIVQSNGLVRYGVPNAICVPDAP